MLQLLFLRFCGEGGIQELNAPLLFLGSSWSQKLLRKLAICIQIENHRDSTFGTLFWRSSKKSSRMDRATRNGALQIEQRNGLLGSSLMVKRGKTLAGHEEEQRQRLWGSGTKYKFNFTCWLFTIDRLCFDVPQGWSVSTRGREIRTMGVNGHSLFHVPLPFVVASRINLDNNGNSIEKCQMLLRSSTVSFLVQRRKDEEEEEDVGGTESQKVVPGRAGLGLPL